jgi:division protein 1
MFSMARTTPTDLVRSKLSAREIQSRALSYLPEEMLKNIPEDDNSYSLFQGFQASFPELTDEGKKHRRRVSRGRKMLEENQHTTPDSPQAVHKLKKEKSSMMHELDMLGIRKNMASSEIREIDNKIANLAGMRKIILERLAGLEQEEALLEHDSKMMLSLAGVACRLSLTITLSHRCRREVRRSTGTGCRGRVNSCPNAN